MGKYTRYFTGALGWLLFIAGLFAAYNVNINGMNPNYPELPTFEQANTLIFMQICLLYTSPSPRDEQSSRMPSSA